MSRGRSLPGGSGLANVGGIGESPPNMAGLVRFRSMSLAAVHAALAAAGYAAVAAAYILVSGELVSFLADDAAQLHRLEAMKGLGFVLVTAVALFCVVRWSLTATVRSAKEVEKSRAAFLAAERRATATRFAAAIAHDFNNMLAVVDAVADGLAHAEDRAERMQLLAEIEAATKRAKELTRRLIDAARGEDEEASKLVDLGELLREVLGTLTERVLRGRPPELIVDQPVLMRVYPTSIRQIAVNLLLNARDAAGRDGRIVLRLRPAGSGAVLEVEDDGPGIPLERRERVFEAFFTTKTTGTGLGLLSVQAAAQRHRGKVEVLPSELGGARFLVLLESLEG